MHRRHMRERVVGTSVVRFCFGRRPNRGALAHEVTPTTNWPTRPTTGSIQRDARRAMSPRSATRTFVRVLGAVSAAWLGTVGSALAATWHAQPVPVPRVSFGQLAAVSCSSAATCTAVGAFPTGFGGHGALLIARWSDGIWEAQSAPIPAGSKDSALSAVSCPSRVVCVAVGWYEVSKDRKWALIERWDGTRWAIQRTPKPGASLSAVSCASGQSCMAVGSAQSGKRTLAVAERWGGREWSVDTTPARSSVASSVFSGVSCVTAGPCVAVGREGGSLYGSTLAERWDEQRWSLDATPNMVADRTIGGPNSSELQSVSCTSDGACTAAGNSTSWCWDSYDRIWSECTQVALIERWDGSHWSIQHVGKAAADDASLGTVSCPSASSCTAIGGNGILSQEGATWTAYSTPQSIESLYPQIFGLSCPSRTACIAVGSAGDSNSGLPSMTLALLWNGSRWAVQDTKRVARAAADAELRSVSCPTHRLCVAVGSFLAASGVPMPLAERWNGSRWSIEASPTPADGGHLDGISCPSRTACIAVGSTESRTLVEAWNGRAWKIQSSPTPSKVTSHCGYVIGCIALSGVSCASATSCLAVGHFAPTGRRLDALAETWDGKRWRMASPLDISHLSVLTGVACSSTVSCIAVGGGRDGIAEHWDGSSWSSQLLPDPNEPNAIACASLGTCAVVGGFAATGESPLIEGRENGDWTVTSHNDVLGAELLGVTCVSSGTCVAVGDGPPARPRTSASPLVATWNGTRWAFQSVPVDGTSTAQLTGVDCVTTTECEAVGDTRSVFAARYGVNAGQPLAVGLG